MNQDKRRTMMTGKIQRLLKCLNRRWIIYPVLLVLIYPLGETALHSMMRMNGFVIEQPLIPADEIFQGGPPRDGIPSIDNPVFVTANEASFLTGTDRVLGVTLNGVTKAYGIRILNYHELVNDVFNKQPVVVSFCPLCGTGMAFDATGEEGRLVFGVSGLLYNSDLLMYDRQTESLWSQIEGKAVSGPSKGVKLKRLVVAHTSWADWRQRHPDTLVLSEETGYSRNYRYSPYPGYQKSEGIYFPVSNSDKRYHPKEVVIGVEVDGEFKAYPFVELAKGQGVLTDRLAGQLLTVEYKAEARSAIVKNEQGDAIPALTGFWFAWVAFHPETQVYVYNK